MIAQGRGGRIISVSSQAGKTGYPILAPYSATKGAVILLTQALAKELGAFKITVNCVCPGTIDTPLLRGGVEPIAQAAGQSFEDFLLKNMPPIVLGRIGYPEDVAKVITFLASDEGDYMTGQAINITGGQEMH
jgi:NAD(P)-dependent dehydrogenase (short-subunit alcohol dehydrogenase family)